MPPRIDTRNTYYLRNVQTQQHLHISDSKVTSGPKSENPSHQWKFIPAGSASADYFIQNLGNSEYLGFEGNRYAHCNGFYIVSTSKIRSSWKVSWHSTAFKIDAVSSSGDYIVDPTDTRIYAATSAFKYNSCDQQPNRFMWHLDPVTNLSVDKNPLPDGNYRIRSFIGSYVLVVPGEENGRPYVRKQVQDNNAQEWAVQPQPNGLYTIRNIGTKLYLAGSASNLVKGAPLIGRSTAFEWDIQTSGLGVMFFIYLPDDPLSIGFPNYDAENLSEVTLQASDNIPSQIWFFETSEPLAPATFHTERLIKPGTYILESCQNNHYLSISPLSDLHLVSGVHEATQFTVTYAHDHTSKFTLSDQDPDGALFLYADRDRIMALDKKTEWVVLPFQRDSVTVYRICDSASANPRRALSSQKKLVRRKEYFLLDPLVEHEVMQMWKFCPVRQMPWASDGLG